MDELGRSAERGVERAERRDQFQLGLRVDPPQRPGTRARRLDRDPHGLLGGPSDIDACSKRLTGQLEPPDAPARRGGAALRRERLHRERELRRNEIGDGAFVVGEGRGDPEQLDRADDSAAGTCGHDERAGRADASGGASDRLRYAARCDRLGGRPRAGDLGCERRRLGRDGTCRQVPVVVDHAHDREVGVRGASCDADDRGQRSAQIRRRGDLCRGVGEQFDGQPLGFDDHRKGEYCLHFPHG